MADSTTSNAELFELLKERGFVPVKEENYFADERAVHRLRRATEASLLSFPPDGAEQELRSALEQVSARFPAARSQVPA